MGSSGRKPYSSTRQRREENNALLFSELSLVLQIAIPTLFIQVLQIGMWTLSSISSGKLGTDELAAFALTLLTANLIGNSLLFGLLTAMDSLAPREYGLGRISKVGILLQRSYLICLVFFVPFAVIWINASPVLSALGQPEAAVRLTSRFLRVYTLAIPSILLNEVIRRYFVVFNVVKPFMIIQVGIS